jgi:hypothetical protein
MILAHYLITSGKKISGVKGYVRYKPFVPVYLTPMYILYIPTGVVCILIRINTYRYIFHIEESTLI